MCFKNTPTGTRLIFVGSLCTEKMMWIFEHFANIKWEKDF